MEGLSLGISLIVVVFLVVLAIATILMPLFVWVIMLRLGELSKLTKQQLKSSEMLVKLAKLRIDNDPQLMREIHERRQLGISK